MLIYCKSSVYKEFYFYKWLLFSFGLIFTYYWKLNLTHIDTQSLRNRISVVQQKIDLFSGNVLDNIVVGVFDPNMEKIINICDGILGFIENLPNGLIHISLKTAQHFPADKSNE